MSLSIVPYSSILRHPTNNSVSKQVHQFAKAPRFQSVNPECSNAFYIYDSHLSKRHTGFGYGAKSDFTRTLTVSPPATKYEIKTFVDHSKSKGKSFGITREKLPNNSYLIPQIQKNPGPGTYQNDKLKHQNLSFTTRSKPVDFIEKKLSFKSSPGPGTYEQIDFENLKGRFKVSKYSDHKYSIIHPRTSRFSQVKQSPGPANYIEGDNLNGKGTYVSSKRVSNGSRVFSKKQRFGDSYCKTSETPGPGAYRQTSQFGYYGDSNFYKTLEK